MSERIQEKVVAYVEDAHAMEQGVLRMLDSMIASTKDPELKSMLEHHQEETKEQSARLERRLGELGEDPSRVKDVGTSVLALPKGLFDQLRSEKPSRNARDGYMTEHMEIASYQLLERVAGRIGDQRTVDIARQNRREEEEMARKIDSSWDKVVDLTLGDEGSAGD